ncbi:MAG: FAD binding domain-containing protein [Thaumarchaeota archaeon]|nr:FAD binding domain-containing protein [Nitrososphaerota archaeon]
MVINSFKYCAPTTLEEACSFLYDQGEEAKLLAGGQSLIPLLKLNLIKPRYVVDLKRIPDLSFISLDQSEDALEIGALTTHSEIVRSSLVCHFTPLLAETALGIGHPLIRNRGTIGGSLCHCDPAADYCPTMLVLEAEMTVVGSGGVTRTVSSKDFIKGTFETDLRRGELLKKVRIKNSNKENEATGYSIKKLKLIKQRLLKRLILFLKLLKSKSKLLI